MHLVWSEAVRATKWIMIRRPNVGEMLILVILILTYKLQNLSDRIVYPFYTSVTHRMISTRG